MANDNNNTTTKLGIDVGQFKRGLQDAQRQIKLANSEFKKAASGMDKWSESTEGVQAKIKQLETTLDAENKKLELQKQRLAEVEKEQGKNSAGAQELRIQIANQEAAIAKTEKSLGYYNNKLSDLKKAENQAKSATGQLTSTIDAQEKELDALKQKYANVILEQGKNSKEAKALAKQISNLSGDLSENKKKLSDAETAADGFDNSLKDVGKAADDAGDKALKFSDVLGANLLSSVIIGGFNLLKQAVQGVSQAFVQGITDAANYADTINTESIVTGIATDKLQEYQYMAGLVDVSLDTITGSMTRLTRNMATAQGGTGAAADAFAALGVSITDTNGNLRDNEDVFNDAITALGQVENETERDALAMQIFGKSAQELNPLIAAGGDKLAAFADEAHEMGYVLDEETLGSLNAVQNEIDRFGVVTDGVRNQLVAGFAPIVSEVIPMFTNAFAAIPETLENEGLAGVGNIFGTLVGNLLNYATELLPGVTDFALNLITTFSNVITTNLPQLTTVAVQIITTLIRGAASAIPLFVNSIVEIIPAIISAIISAAPELLGAGITLLMALVNAIPLILPLFTRALPQLITQLVRILNQNIPVILNAAVQLLSAILDAIPVVIQSLLPLLPQIVNSIVNVLIANVPVILNGAITLLMAIVQAIPVIITSLVSQLPTIINQIITTLTNNIPVLLNAAVQFLMTIVRAIPEIVAALVPVLPDIINAIIQVLIENIPLIMQYSFTMFMAIVDAIPGFIVELISGLADIVATIIENFIDPVKNFFSKLWEDIKLIYSVVGDWFREKFTTAWNNITTAFANVKTWFTARWNDIKNVFNSVGTWFKTKFTDAWNNIKAVFEPVGEFFGDLWDTIKEKFTNIGQKIGDAVSDAFKTAVNAVLSTATNLINGFIRAINTAIDVINAIPGVSISKLSELDIPQLARGGILKRGQIGLLEGDGSEAVVPLDQNKKWINATARAMTDALTNQGVINNNSGNVINNYNFTQNNTSPKALSRLEIYRQTKNQFNLMIGVTGG